MVVFEADGICLALVFDRGIGVVSPDEVQGCVDEIGRVCESEDLEPETIILIGGARRLVEPNVMFRQKGFSIDSRLVQSVRS